MKDGIIIFGVVVLVFVCIVQLAFAVSNTEPMRVELMAFGDNITPGGNLWLGSGVIEGRLSYAFYVQRPGGAIRGMQWDARYASIYEDESERPYAILPRKTLSQGIATDYPAEFHVPPGTLQRIYRMDLGKGGQPK